MAESASFSYFQYYYPNSLNLDQFYYQQRVVQCVNLEFSVDTNVDLLYM